MYDYQALQAEVAYRTDRLTGRTVGDRRRHLRVPFVRRPADVRYRDR